MLTGGEGDSGLALTELRPFQPSVDQLVRAFNQMDDLQFLNRLRPGTTPHLGYLKDSDDPEFLRW
jgi:hypothetical protein